LPVVRYVLTNASNWNLSDGDAQFKLVVDPHNWNILRSDWQHESRFTFGEVNYLGESLRLGVWNNVLEVTKVVDNLVHGIKNRS